MGVTLDDVAARFDRDGFVIVAGVLEERIVEGARRAMTALVDREAGKLAAAGKIHDPLAGAPFESRLAELYRTCPDEAPAYFRHELHLAELHPIFFHPALLDLAEGFLGPEVRLYPNYTARPKLPDHAPTEVLWHQDGGYTGGDADLLRMVNVWTPLVPARVENGCMEFIPGTHRLGVVPHEQRKHYLEIAYDVLKPRLSGAVPVELDPGDVVLFHNLLFHRGLLNRSATIRWSLDWRYQDATQPTLRKEEGHLARSRRRGEATVRSPKEWASRAFG